MIIRKMTVKDNCFAPYGMLMEMTLVFYIQDDVHC